MKLMVCPLNGPRNIDEFQCFGVAGGPANGATAPAEISDAEWSSGLFRAENRAGRVLEWWRHVPSNHYFLAERDLVSNEILRTFDAAGARDG